MSLDMTLAMLPLHSMTPCEVRVLHGLPRKTKPYCLELKRGVKGLIPAYGNVVSILFRRRRKMEAKEFWAKRYNIAVNVNHRKKQTLRGFNQLPMELIFEIFSYLHPLELYDLLTTCRAIREVLVSKQSHSIWQAAYRAHPDIPPCPEDMSYPSWTTLLFGPDICYKCDSKRSRVDFVFRWKLCQHCWEELMQPLPGGHPFNSKDWFSKNQLRSVCRPDYLTQLRYLDGPKWYLKADIRRVSEEISTISKMAETDEASLSAYRDRQKLLAEELEEPMQYASLCDTWTTLVMQELEATLQPIIDSILQGWGKYLSRQDYDQADIDTIIGHEVVLAAAVNQMHGVKINKREMGSLGLARGHKIRQPTTSPLGHEGGKSILPSTAYSNVPLMRGKRIAELPQDS